MNKKIAFVLLITILLMSFSFHKYYVSMCEIEYIEEQNSIQIILGLFIDDLELTLNKKHNSELFLATKNEVKSIDSLYINYLQENFKLTINSSPKKIDFIGKEYNDDIVHFYLEIPNIETLNSFEVINTCLLKDFEDQQNIVKLKVNNFHKSFYLDKRKPKGLLIF